MKCTPSPTADIKMEAMPGVGWGGVGWDGVTWGGAGRSGVGGGCRDAGRKK